MDEMRTGDREEQKRFLRAGMIRGGQAPEENTPYEKRLAGYEAARRRRRRMIGIAVCAVLVIGLIIFFVLRGRQKHYEGLAEKWTQALPAESVQRVLPFGAGFLRCGRNSCACVDTAGEVVWTEGYEMNHPQTAVCGEYAAIADLGGNSLVIVNADGKQGEVTTALPITGVTIAGQGMAVLILEDETANYLAFYDRTGKKLDIEIRSMLTGDGYPFTAALSPSGSQLMVSFVCVRDGEVCNKVIFYNFDVGRDMVDNIVGGFEQYEGMMVPRVTYLDEERAVAFADACIGFYSLRHQSSPALIKDEPVEQHILAVFPGEGKSGVVTEKSATESTVRVYDRDGGVTAEFDVDAAFTGFAFAGSRILAWHDGLLVIYDTSGREVARHIPAERLVSVVPSPSENEYFLFLETRLQYMQLQ